MYGIYSSNQNWCLGWSSNRLILILISNIRRLKRTEVSTLGPNTWSLAYAMIETIELNKYKDTDDNEGGNKNGTDSSSSISTISSIKESEYFQLLQSVVLSRFWRYV